MKSFAQAIRVGLTLAQLAAALPAAELETPGTIKSRAACNANGLHIFVVRASTETSIPNNEGVTGEMVTVIEETLTTATDEGIPYPASLTDYVNSETQGITALTSTIQGYVQNCPSGKYALMGYSQVRYNFCQTSNILKWILTEDFRAPKSLATLSVDETLPVLPTPAPYHSLTLRIVSGIPKYDVSTNAKIRQWSQSSRWVIPLMSLAWQVTWEPLQTTEYVVTNYKFSGPKTNLPAAFCV